MDRRPFRAYGGIQGGVGVNDSLDVTEGTIDFQGYKVWFRSVDGYVEDGKLPLLVLHGGPGATWDYLQPIDALARTGRRVLYYDQLGCGNSDHPDDPSMWTTELYVEELGEVRRVLGLDQVHLLGSSWGGMLEMLYALTKPKGVASLTIVSSPASIPQWVSEANRLREDLPPEVQQTLLKHEAAGTTDDPEYEAAMTLFYNRHVCRVVPNPDYVTRTFEKMVQFPQVYHTMNGPSEFHVVGTIKDFDITDRLAEIDIPTLVISGRYDEATPAIAETVHSGIRGSERVLFENSSHMSFVEETDRFMEVVGDFLERVEARHT